MTPEKLAGTIDEMAVNPKGGKMAAIAYRRCARLIREKLAEEEVCECGGPPCQVAGTRCGRRPAFEAGFEQGVAAAIRYHETAADEIRSWPQLEPSSYDVIGFHEEAIAGLQHLVPGRENIVRRVAEAESLLQRLAGEIGFAKDDALVKRIDAFLAGK